MNPEPWQHLTTIEWKSNGADGDWTWELTLSWRMLYHWANKPCPDTCRFRLMTPILLTILIVRDYCLQSRFLGIRCTIEYLCVSPLKFDTLKVGWMKGSWFNSLATDTFVLNWKTLPFPPSRNGLPFNATTPGNKFHSTYFQSIRFQGTHTHILNCISDSLI